MPRCRSRSSRWRGRSSPPGVVDHALRPRDARVRVHRSDRRGVERAARPADQRRHRDRRLGGHNGSAGGDRGCRGRPPLCPRRRQSTGFVPKGLMAAPLLLDERVLGVLWVLDRPAQARFTLTEMELLGALPCRRRWRWTSSSACARHSSLLIAGRRNWPISPARRALGGSGGASAGCCRPAHRRARRPRRLARSHVPGFE